MNKDDKIVRKWADSGFREDVFDLLIEKYPQHQPLLNARKLLDESRSIENQLRQDHPFSPMNKKGNSSIGLYMFGLIALLLLGTGLVWIFNLPDTNYYTTSGEIRSYVLPDGQSSVVLNAVSEIELDKPAWKSHPQLDLDGEALIRIDNTKGIEIRTQWGKITAKRALFAVRSRQNSLSISCKSGQLSLSSPIQQLNLYAGQKVYMTEDTWERAAIPPERIGTWVEGIRYYSNSNLTECLEDLNYVFGEYHFLIDESLSEIRYSGYFKTNELSDALNTICTPLQIRFSISEEKKVVRLYP